MTASIARRVLMSFRAPAGNAPSTKPLSPREVDILTLLAKGLERKEIADQLNIHTRTVGTHLGNIYGKLHVHNAAGAVGVFLSGSEE